MIFCTPEVQIICFDGSDQRCACADLEENVYIHQGQRVLACLDWVWKKLLSSHKQHNKQTHWVKSEWKS